jgi:hypothetical protein
MASRGAASSPYPAWRLPFLNSTRPSAFLGNELEALLDAEEVPFIQV